jgi:DNA-directed RNA polymerase specialized sigma24 family protein
VSEKTSHAVRGADDTGEVIGAEFTGVLHAAQQGRVAAFVRLWSDVNPALTRYLRVVAVADADDIACESWVAVLRRLSTFEGDETAWRTLVFSCARMHAEDENQRRVWDAMVEDAEVSAVVATPLPPGEEPFEEDEAEGGPAHGLRMALEAIRDLPPEQGEVLMLRQVGLLPAEEVARLVGSDVGAVHALEQEALDQLGLDAELLAWSIGVEPRPVEVADEAALVAVFRALVPEQSPSSPASSRDAVSPGGARVISLRRPTWRTRAGAAAAASAAVLGMGAFSAAAYQGVLPDPVQNVMHVVIGAPEPAPESPTATSAAPAGRTRTATAAATPSAPGVTRSQSTSTRAGQPPMTAALDLCRTWEAERERGVTEDRSASFRSLAQAAGGDSQVGRYCAASGVPLAPLTAGPSKVSPSTPAKVTTPPTTSPTTEPGPTPTPSEPTNPTTEPGPTPTPSEPTNPTTEPQPTTGSGSGSTGAGTDTGTVGRGASTGKGRAGGAAGTKTDDPSTDTSGTGVGRGRLKG